MAKVYMPFLKIINLTLKPKKKEFIMQEEKFIKVVLWQKMETQYMVLLEFNQESYQFLDLLEIFKPNFLPLKEMQKF